MLGAVWGRHSPAAPFFFLETRMTELNSIGASVRTTERHLGCKQRLREAVNDKIGLETLKDSSEG
jgi:hypothetical protein